MNEFPDEHRNSTSFTMHLLGDQVLGELYQDSRELKQWLIKSNCQHHYNKFIENGITFDLLPELDSSSLKEIGINKLGDRLRLELAISSMKSEKLADNITVDELYKIMNLHLTDSITLLSGGNISNGSVSTPTNESGTLTTLTNNPYLHSNVSSSSNAANKDANKNVTFILQDGSTKKVNVTGCFNAQSIKRKVLKRLGIKQQETLYNTYIHTSLNSKSNPGVNLLFDVELVTICYSPDRLEKHRIILCRKDEYPSDMAIESSKRLMAKYERYSQTDSLKTKSQDNFSQYHMPDPRKTHASPILRNFFGQRPPSELISSNLAEYFPEAHQKDLEATVRNSVRYSVRLSRRFNLPSSILSGASSNISIHNSQNKRSSILSNGTVSGPNGAPGTPSVSSMDQNSVAAKRKPSGRTIGEMMVNNINAIDQAVSSNDVQSVFSKPQSIGSDISGPGQGSFEPKSMKSHTSPILNRSSIAASFVDPFHTDNNRNSRIELLSIDSDDDEDDFIDEYGTYTSGELDHDFKDNMLDSISEDGPKNWLQGARIGAGSFGTVYLGMNPLTGELMAVKQVSLPDKNSINNSLQTAMIEALQHEMTLLKEINHENIVRYLGSSTDDNFLNIFLEYVPGGSVQSMLSSYGPFEEPLIRNFIRQILIGLSYLHGEDIIHRDIKGANILIDIKGTVKISDFGISKKVGNSDVDMDDETNSQKKGERRASLQGSVYWMAPEVVKQTAYTKKADIWSVGCLIVEMFTGKHPFPDFSQMQAIFKIGTHIIPQIPEWCTSEAKDFLYKTFELDYEKRPDAIDMLAEPFLNPLIMSKQ